MKALVTGATGFVGGHLIETLLARGDEVTALVRSPRKAASLPGRGVHLVEGDLSDAAALVEACAGQEIVYHAAGLIAARTEAEFLAVNRDGTARLLQAAVRAGAVTRFVLVSSLAAAGPSPPGRPHTGEEPARPVTAYGRSKLAGEGVVRGGPVPWTILRPPAVYGPGDREMWRIFRAATLGIAPVFGNGSQRLSLIYGPDLAAALVVAGSAERGRGRIFFPCHPEIVTSRALLEAIGRAAGRRVWVVPIPASFARGLLAVTEAAAALTGRATVLTRDKANEFLQAAWTCDPGPLTSATGWQAKHDLATGVGETLAWYRSRGWL